MVLTHKAQTLGKGQRPGLDKSATSDKATMLWGLPLLYQTDSSPYFLRLLLKSTKACPVMARGRVPFQESAMMQCPVKRKGGKRSHIGLSAQET